MRLTVSAFMLVAIVVNASGIPAAQLETSETAQARRLLVEASQLVKGIPEYQQSSAASNIAGQLARTGDLPDAFATARMLPKAEDQTFAMGIIAWQLAHEGDVAQALALVRSMPEGQNRGLAYEWLSEILAEKGDFQGALQTANLICNDPDRLVDTLVRVATRLAKTGDRSGVREVIEDALSAADQAAKQNIGHAIEFTQIAATQAEIGERTEAFRTLDRFSDIVRQNKGAEGNGVFLQQLASAQAQIGDLVGAERTVEEISPGNSDFALMLISQEQAKQGLVIDALANAERICNPAFKTSAFREIAMIRGTHGTLDDALEAIDHIPDPAGRAEALSTLALEQAENENPAAGRTLQEASLFAKQIDGDASNEALGTTAVARALLGDLAGAEQMVQEITEPESRVWPLWNITASMVRCGHTQEAISLAENQTTAHAKAYALLGTAQGILDLAETKEKASTGER